MSLSSFWSSTDQTNHFPRIDHVPVKRKRKVTRGRVSIYSTREELHAVNKNISSHCVNLTEKKQKLKHKSHDLNIK